MKFKIDFIAAIKPTVHMEKIEWLIQYKEFS